MKGNNMFISRFWVKFKFYRKYKKGNWYKIRVPKGSATDGFEFWSRNPPDYSWGETLVSQESYQ